MRFSNSYAMIIFRCEIRFYYLIAPFLLLHGCKYSQEKEKNINLIVCTTSIIADCIRQIVPINIKVVALMGAGVDPHMYKALPKDLNLLDKADVVIINGLHLEAKLDAVFRELKKRKNIISVGDGIEVNSKLSHGKAAYDPHIWFDLVIWKHGMKYVSWQLIKEFPEVEDEIKKNWISFQESINKLEQHIISKIETIPVEKRILITSHDAFSYFGRRYHFQIKAVQGMNTMIEAGLNDNQSLIQFVIKNKVSALFIETSVSSKSIESIQEACRYRKHKIKLGKALCSDALGSKNSKEGTYFGMIESNVDKIINGLK
jgi:manganese/zinc/iron transport system substrate-binding protein